MIINGTTVTAAEIASASGTVTVADVVAHLTGAPDTEGVAVAVGDMVVPRSQWSTTLDDDAVVEVLSAVQGG